MKKYSKSEIVISSVAQLNLKIIELLQKIILQRTLMVILVDNQMEVIMLDKMRMTISTNDLIKENYDRSVS